MSKPRDLNSLSWMPGHVPVSAGIFKRGFYLKDGVIKYRHGLKRRVIDGGTPMGKLFHALILLFIISVFSFFFYSRMLLMMPVTLLIFIIIVYVIGYQRFRYAEFNLENSSVTGLRCYKEGSCLDFLFPDKSFLIGLSASFHSVELCDVMRFLVYSNKKSLWNDGISCFFVIASDVLDDILLSSFAYLEEDYLNDYLDGIKAILGREVWVDESEK